MAAASEGAREAAGWRPGTIIGVLPGDSPDEANPWVEIALPTGLGHGRNAVVARADAVIAVGGGAGTLSEMAFAWLHDRLIIGLRCGGWSERLAGERLDERVRWPGIPDDCVWSAGDSAEALALLERWLKACGAGGAGR